jgi:hypothetical protein
MEQTTRRKQAFLWDTEAKGLGVRATAGSKSFVWQGKLHGAAIRLTIGSTDDWDIDGSPPNKRLGTPARPGARTEARRLSTLIDQGIDPREEKRQRRESVEATRKAATMAADHTLRALCERYVAHLEHAGKASWRNAASIFRNPVYESAFAETAAKSVTARNVAELLRRVIEAGHGRTAGKLRAYLRAAYALALRAELDADAPAWKRPKPNSHTAQRASRRSRWTSRRSTARARSRAWRAR